ncbi:hypothetical protein HMPREF1051_2416 [Neisseria sicca VK64]|uniref:Uncharacterized protein n=1 Tax=Neisseria sicca VK64 TaxID=1095748 RepID=I2NSN0_NEISI|nr:hypothetical protein HMPREF1051_2416 [Neisseria sicca VK64]
MLHFNRFQTTSAKIPPPEAKGRLKTPFRQGVDVEPARTC